MTRKITVGGAQLGPIARDESRQSVVARMVELMREAHARRCDAVIYPELALTSFFPRWWIEDEDELDSFFEREMPNAATRPLFDEAKRLGIGFSFADAMRSFVRQDPDVILVGEIRDSETALEAIRASQTGHVVLSTLHCNDAVDAVQRLVDLGMHPNSIASELLAVMAQRLAKRICTFCKEQVDPDPEIMAELFPGGAPGDFTAFKGKGCRMCGDHGTRGRIGVVEFLRATEDVRGGISATKPVDELRRIALRTGLLPMRDQGVELARQGIIPLSELPRILPAERMAPEKRD